MRMCWRRRCRRSSPARRSPSARRRTTASITISRPRIAPSPRRICPRSRRRCARSSPPTSRSMREVWSRAELIARWQEQGETFKAEWAAELPEDEELTVYRSGDDWLDMCRGPHLASTGKLDPRRVQADARVGRLLARRPEERDAVSRIYGTGWLNKKQLEQHLDAAGGSRQARPSQDRPGDGPVPPPVRGAGQRVLAPQGLS